MTETSRLSRFVAELRLSDIPEPVVARMKQVILDHLACAVAGTALPWTRAVYDASRDLCGPGPAPVVVLGDRLPVDEAAFVNSAFAHGGDFDEATMRTHPGTVVVPAALAAAAGDESVDGEALLVAIIAGCEVMVRVTEAAMPALKDVRYHNTASSAGPFGAAAAVSRSRGLTAELTEHALAIAGYHSAGLMQHVEGGGSARRLQTAIGARAGVRSAWLAMAGVTGPGEILEGTRGFLRAFAGDYDKSKLTDGLGQTYLASNPCLKRFNVKYRIHSTIDALVRLLDQHGLRFDQISRIRVGVSESTRMAHGVEYEPGRAPDASEAMQAAQFSIRFAVAAVARHGAGVLSRLGSDEYTDPEVLDLARRVEVRRDPALEQAPWMNWASTMSIVTTNDETHTTTVLRPVGSPESPMEDADVEEKFRRLVAPVLGAEPAARILDTVRALEDREPRHDLIPYLVAESREERDPGDTGGP